MTRFISIPYVVDGYPTTMQIDVSTICGWMREANNMVTVMFPWGYEKFYKEQGDIILRALGYQVPLEDEQWNS